jgi:soluble lytic murein transglycosylase-like protein
MLLKAIAMQESGFTPRAVSPKGALGLMQIMPDTAKALGMTDPFDPVQSIFAGAKYLAEGLDKEGNPNAALLYYHGGAGWRQNYGRESADYVPAVAGHYKALQAAQTPPPTPAAPDYNNTPTAPPGAPQQPPANPLIPPPASGY